MASVFADVETQMKTNVAIMGLVMTVVIPEDSFTVTDVVAFLSDPRRKKYVGEPSRAIAELSVMPVGEAAPAVVGMIQPAVQ